MLQQLDALSRQKSQPFAKILFVWPWLSVRVVEFHYPSISRNEIGETGVIKRVVILICKMPSVSDRGNNLPHVPQQCQPLQSQNISYIIRKTTLKVFMLKQQICWHLGQVSPSHLKTTLISSWSLGHINTFNCANNWDFRKLS